MHIRRVRTLESAVFKTADFSFDIDCEAIPPFDGPGLGEVVAVAPYRKTYGATADVYADTENGDRLVTLATDAGRVAGYIVASRGWNDCAVIDDLAVDQSARRRGVGRLLLDDAIEWAQQAGLTILRLETQSNNVPACRFYERHGFVLGGYDRYLYRGLQASVRSETALFWYRFLDGR